MDKFLLLLIAAMAGLAAIYAFMTSGVVIEVPTVLPFVDLITESEPADEAVKWFAAGERNPDITAKFVRV